MKNIFTAFLLIVISSHFIIAADEGRLMTYPTYTRIKLFSLTKMTFGLLGPAAEQQHV